jgi:hypothetical protein
VDILQGRVDANEDAHYTKEDKLYGVALNDLVDYIPSPNQVFIAGDWAWQPGANGHVDVNENMEIDIFDDASDVKLVKLVGSLVDRVDIIDGQVDVTQSGAISSGDDLTMFSCSSTTLHRSGWTSSTAGWT